MGSRLRLLARLSSANIRRHRVRWALTTLGIAVGVTAFAGVLAITRSITYAFEQSVVRTAGKAQLQVSNGSAGVDRGLVDVITAVPGVEVASGNVQFGVTVPALKRRLTIFGVSLGSEQAYREEQFGPDALELPDSFELLIEGDSIAVSTEVLEEQGWTIGSKVEVLGPKGRRDLVVRGRLKTEGALWIPAAAGGLMMAPGVASAHLSGRFGVSGDVLSVGTFAALAFLGTTLLVPLFLAVVTPVLRRLLAMRWQALGTWTWEQVLKRRFHTATTIGALAAEVTFTVAMAMLVCLTTAAAVIAASLVARWQMRGTVAAANAHV